MKTNALLALVGLSGSALSASLPVRGPKQPEGSYYKHYENSNVNGPFGYKAGSPLSIANLKGKIQNVVWIILENRAFDNILGGVHYPGLDNVINSGPFHNPENVSRPYSYHYGSIEKDFDQVSEDPDHSVTGNNYEFFGTWHPNQNAIESGALTPKMHGFVDLQIQEYYKKASKQTCAEDVFGYYRERDIPTLLDLVYDFTTFNYWHSDVPGVSFFFFFFFF